ncbi:MAG: membrane protein insertase YidC [Clostridia bacterium]|nr:membrane protein insertase YidC [Clostridia bacterium]
MFDWIAEILKYVMIFCDKISFHNYALALFLFALIVKLALFPFSIKQQKNQVKAAHLRPKEYAIRKKYNGRTDKTSQQNMQMELQEMYQREGYSQFSGCLPMLIQLPVLYSLYAIIQNPLYYVCRFGVAQIEAVTEAYNRVQGIVVKGGSAAYSSSIKILNFIGDEGNAQKIIEALPVDGVVPAGAKTVSGEAITEWSVFVQDITYRLTEQTMPNFKLFGFIDLAIQPNEQMWWYILVPVVVFLAMFATMKIQKKFTYQPAASADVQNNISMKMMDVMMPAMSAFISWSLPTALAFYWVYQNVLGLAQQIALSKMFPIPKLSDDEIRRLQREAEKEAAAAKKAEAAVKKENANKRSLHHIDDDEEYIPRKAADNSMEDDSRLIKNKEKPSKKKGSAIQQADIKEDKKETNDEENK